MKCVLHCIASLNVGGVEARVLDMFKHFIAHGSRYRHVLCAFRGGRLAETHLPSLRRGGVECHVLERKSRYSVSFCKSFREVVRQVAPDIVQAYNPTAALWARLLVGGRGAPKMIVHCGGVGGLRLAWRMIERALLSRADAFVFNSKSTRAVWEGFLPMRCPRRVIYNGVTFDANDAGQSVVLPSSPFVLLTVCRVVPVKALHVQIEAVRLLHDRGQRDVRLVIVGDGPILADVKALATRLGIDGSVRFEGYHADPRVFHPKAHVYLCTSYNETFSMTLASAMFDGMICVAGAAGGPSEIIEDGVSGFLLPCTEPLPAQYRRKLPTGQALPAAVFDNTSGRLRAPLGVYPAVLADKIADVRARYDRLDAMRGAARSRIVDHFSVERYCRGLEEVYDQV